MIFRAGHHRRAQESRSERILAGLGSAGASCPILAALFHDLLDRCRVSQKAD